MIDRFIEILKYLVLGFVQGACEILPISSSGHIEIFQHIFKMNALDVSFSIMLHFASLIAVVIFLRKKIVSLIKGTYLYLVKKDANYKGESKYTLMLFISTLVTGLIGLLLNDYIDGITKIGVVGICLIINSIWLLIVQAMTKKAKNDIEKVSIIKALLIGLGQGVGILPGISRSGSALGTSVIAGIKKEDAAEYAFLLFVPIELGAIILKVGELTKTEKSLIIPYFLSFLIAGITTYFALKIFLEIIRKKKLSWFAIYCFAAGIMCLLIKKG